MSEQHGSRGGQSKAAGGRWRDWITKGASFYGGKWFGEGNALLDPANGRSKRMSSPAPTSPSPGSARGPVAASGGSKPLLTAPKIPGSLGVSHVSTDEGDDVKADPSNPFSMPFKMPVHTYASGDREGFKPLVQHLAGDGWKISSAPRFGGGAASMPGGYGADAGANHSQPSGFHSTFEAERDGQTHRFVVQHRPTTSWQSNSAPAGAIPPPQALTQRPQAPGQPPNAPGGVQARPTAPMIPKAPTTPKPSTMPKPPTMGRPAAPAGPMTRFRQFIAKAESFHR